MRSVEARTDPVCSVSLGDDVVYPPRSAWTDLDTCREAEGDALSPPRTPRVTLSLVRPKSVADALLERRKEWLASLSPQERVQLARDLGEQSLRLYQQAHGVTRDEALAQHRAARQRGRIRSRCAGGESG